MVDVSNNISNKIAKPDIGVLVVPNQTYKPRIFNSTEARQKFKELGNDIYEKKEEISYEKTVPTPIGIKVIAGLSILAIIASAAKKFIKKRP